MAAEHKGVDAVDDDMRYAHHKYARFVEYASETDQPEADRVYVIRYTGNEDALKWLASEIEYMRHYRLYMDELMTEEQVGGVWMVMDLTEDRPLPTGPAIVILEGSMGTVDKEGAALREFLRDGGIMKLFKD